MQSQIKQSSYSVIIPSTTESRSHYLILQATPVKKVVAPKKSPAKKAAPKKSPAKKAAPKKAAPKK